jgi:RNA polymerase sigma-70 factor (ECF subfamily)
VKQPAALEPSPRPPSVPTLEQVYRDHADFVWRLLRNFGVEGAGLDDAFHEVFLVVYRRLGDYDGRASLPSWLFGITRNVVLHHRRSHARHQRRLTVAPEPSAGPQPDEVIAQLEARALIDRFLATLGEEHRIVFMLAELEGLRVPEIAEQLGVNLNTLYSRLNSARRRFASFVAGGRDGSAESE